MKVFVGNGNYWFAWLRLITVQALVCALVMGVWQTSASAAECPPRLQAHILKKVLKMTERYRSAKEIIVTYRKDKQGAEDVSKHFTKIGFKVLVVADYGLLTVDSELIYVFESSDQVAAHCEKKNTLCLGGSVDFVNDGQVEIAVGKRGKKPKIFVNLKRLRQKEIKVRQELVRLSEVVDE